MSNSPLVNYTRLSPNNSGKRNHDIDTITIHCVVGQTSVETLGALFAQPSRQASSNYGIGYDGSIGLYVPEDCRSWCSSNSANDNRAVTIEVASDTFAPYAVKAAAYNSLILLVADICKRNGIKALKWSNNKNERAGHRNGVNMTVHRDYANKSCPGDYLYSKMGDIASKVNALLRAGNIPTPEPTPTEWDKADVQVLRKGAEGNSVLALQWLLNNWAARLNKSSFYCGAADGIFGSKTERAVVGFQAEYGLPQTGEVDGLVWAYLLC